MNNAAPESGFSRRVVFLGAFRYSFPVLLGYTAIGIGFGLLLSRAGYPWWLALVMSVWMYAGAGQYIALGLFAAGTGLLEACLVQLVVNARHIAYGLSLLGRFAGTGQFKPYLVFSLTDETFALLASRPVPPSGGEGKERLFIFYLALLDQAYWVLGSVAGAAAGSLIPFELEGIGFALTALFVVLMVEQILKAGKPGVFVVSGAAALLGVFFLPSRISLLAALALALGAAYLMRGKSTGARGSVRG